jgi:polyisoprenyl-teichoic acid--peptidoglycan teichoic acid transferase
MPSTRGGVLGRAMVAAVLVIGCVAATTAVAVLLQVKQVVGYANQNAAIRGANVTLPQPGQPQTLLLIGVDHRYDQGSGVGQTDTMLLVRIDDSSKTINLLSVPRDLKVNLPGVGAAKLNAAYSDGGPDELLATLQNQVFPGLHVNQILVSTFTGFAQLVNEIGCVYTDVDHRYYNNTVQTDYSSIDIQPGYQKLCGGSGSNIGGPNTALAFVRFRHTDSDEVRNARQQDFIRWAKDQYSSSQLLAEHTTLLKTFFKYTQVTNPLHTTAGILNFVDLVLNADSLELKTVQFPEAFGPCVAGQGSPCYVFPISQELEQQAYTEFMTPTTSVPKVGLRGITIAKPSSRKHHRRALTGAASTGLVADPGDGKSQAGQLGNVGMPVYYPGYIASDSQYCFSITENCLEPPNPASEYDGSYPRDYTIDGPDNKRYPAYVMTLVISMGAGQYYTVQGTTWQDPPILGKPTLEKVVNGKRLDIYSQGGLISTVAWHTRKGVYWIQNDLQNTVPNAEMVGMAASLTLAPPE